MKARHFISANFSKLLLSALFGPTISLTCAAQEKIAFTSNIGGNNNIWLMNASGSNRVQLTTDIGSDSYPNISKDGTKIVFVSDRDGNPAALRRDRQLLELENAPALEHQLALFCGEA